MEGDPRYAAKVQAYAYLPLSQAEVGLQPIYGPVNLINHGIPYVVVEDGDFEGRRELYLKPYHDGKDLDLQYAEKTLPYVHQLWGRRVHLETKLNGKTALLSCDGGNVTKKVH